MGGALKADSGNENRPVVTLGSNRADSGMSGKIVSILEILRPNRKVDSAASKRFTVGADRASTRPENRGLADYGIRESDKPSAKHS